jgi:hypothetical protein
MAAQRSDYTVEVISRDLEMEGMVKVLVTADTLLAAPSVQDNWEIGSLLWEVSTGTWYGLATDGTWQEQ